MSSTAFRNNYSLDGFLITEDAPLDFASFRTCVEKRSLHLSNIFKELGKSGHYADAGSIP